MFLNMTAEEITAALASDSAPEPLFAEADRVRRQYMGDEVHLRGLIEFSNICTRHCLYCGIRAATTKLKRYRLTKDEILACAKKAKKLDYQTVVLQSGEDPFFTPKMLAEIVSAIKDRFDLAVTLSVGEFSREDYRLLRSAGADRFLLRFETSDRKLFSVLKPDSDYDTRFRCLRDLKDAGFQVGSGIMVGLPGQSMESIARDILLFRDLELDMVGIGPFIPSPETPLAGVDGGTALLALKTVALARLATLNTHIPATTALGSIDPEGRQKALRCGANVLMPNVSPTRVRAHYKLYPGKICIADDASQCAGCVDRMLSSLGRTRAKHAGHSLKRKA